jgi:signal transduction histidine kinase
MRTYTPRRSFGRWLLPAFLAVTAIAPTQPALGQELQRQILVLYSARRDAQIVNVSEREFPRILDQGLREGLDYYSEYIDRARFPDDGYKTAFRDFLRLKYKDKRFDAIIAVQDISLEFIRENRTELFADSPIVYFANTPTTPLANSTGLVAALDLSGTLALIAQLQPDVRQLFVVSGTEVGDKEYERVAREQFRSFESRFSITYLSGLPTRDLEQRLSSLPGHSAVYYLVVNRDGGGEYFHPLEYLDRLAAIANAPIYCWVDSAMNHGIVGGSLKSQQAQADAVARLALRVLHGEAADSIPVASTNLNAIQVDWRQLRRWGISEARLPLGTAVRFRESSAWERYRIYILGVVALLVAQSVLIAGLLVQRARRRIVETQLRGREAELRNSYDRIRALGRRLLSAQEAERSRIARELHDDFAQQLALLSINLEQLANSDDQDGRESTSLAHAALDRLHSLAHSMRDLSHRLHPAKLQLMGLVPSLSSLPRELSRPGLSITFTHQNVPPGLSHDLTLCVYRVVQEALQNAIRHSSAQNVSVNLRGDAETLLLTVTDDGMGFDVGAEWGTGLGLLSMTERLESINGAVTILSRRGAGTRVEVSVPLPAVRETAAAV